MAMARMRRACLASAVRAASARNCEILRSWRVISIADMMPAPRIIDVLHRVTFADGWESHRSQVLRRLVSLDHHREELTAIRTNLGAIFVSLELSRSIWLITSLSPGSGEKMSKHRVSAGDIAALLTRFVSIRQKAFARTGKSFPIIVIQEAGLDGFWIHRVLQSEGIESYVVDPASIATSRRRRRAKTDRIDGEALVRALLAY